MATEFPLRRFVPGEIAPYSAVYRVLHAKHRAPHEVTLLEGQKFPPCRQCGDDARFELVVTSRPAAAQDPRNAPPALLVADPEPHVGNALRLLFEEKGYTVTIAGSRTEALGLLRRNPFDAVLTALEFDHTPAGLDIARAARVTASGPVVLLSVVDPRPEVLRDVLGLRVDYLIFKPIEVSELEQALARLLARRTDSLQLQ